MILQKYAANPLKKASNTATQKAVETTGDFIGNKTDAVEN